MPCDAIAWIAEFDLVFHERSKSSTVDSSQISSVIESPKLETRWRSVGVLFTP
jgi:hypothetical protein